MMPIIISKFNSREKEEQADSNFDIRKRFGAVRTITKYIESKFEAN